MAASHKGLLVGSVADEVPLADCLGATDIICHSEQLLGSCQPLQLAPEHLSPRLDMQYGMILNNPSGRTVGSECGNLCPYSESVPFYLLVIHGYKTFLGIRVQSYTINIIPAIHKYYDSEAVTWDFPVAHSPDLFPPCSPALS